MYGLDTEVINDLKEIFSKFKQINSVIIYGSRAKGNYRKGSDIDLTLLGEGLTLSVVYKINDKIEDLNLPCEFDISIHKQIDNQKLKDHINRVGKVFYRKKIVLPKDWEVKKFDEVISSSLIGIVRNSKEQSPEFSYRYFKMNNIRNDNGLNEDLFTFVNATDEEVKKYRLKENDFLFNTRNSYELVGKTCLFKSDYTEPILFNNNILRVTFKEILIPQFVAYAFSTVAILEELEKMKSGTTSVVGIYYKSLKNLPVPLPPLPEQKRIVDILDKAFAAIAKAKANAEQNLENAKELFESYLKGVLENKSEGWEFTKLKHNIDLLTGFAFKSKYYTDNEEDILLLRGDNIMQGEFRWKDAKKWKKSEYYEFEKYQLQENDIVLAMDRPWVNAGLKCAKVSKTDIPSLLVQRTACLRNNSKINNSFLYYLIKSKGFMDYLLDVQTGIGVPHISGKQISNFTFKKPPINKQKFIVKKLDTLSAETNKLEAIYQQKIEDLEELKKSLLQKAFNGELTEKEIII